MTEMVVRKANVCGEDGNRFALEYYLTEPPGTAAAAAPLLGVEVVKRGPEENGVTRATVAGLRYDKIHLMEMIKRLADGDVTPMCLKEVIEDLLEESRYELMEDFVCG